jgi:hypothetical protein
LPEPGSLLTMASGFGLIGLGLWKRRKQTD